MREVGSDVQERLSDTREMFGIKKAEDGNISKDQNIIINNELIENSEILVEGVN